MAYLQHEDPKKGYLLYFVRMDGAKSETYTSIDPIAFSPVTNKLVYVARSGAAATLVIEGKPPEQFEKIEQLTFSPDGEKVAFIAVKGSELWWRVRNIK